MLSEEQITALRQRVASAIADELTRADIDWAAFDQLVEPSVRVEAEFRDSRSPAALAPAPALGGSGISAAGNQNAEPTSGVIVPSVASHDTPNQVSGHHQAEDTTMNENSGTSDSEDDGTSSRIAISGLRPSRRGIPVVEDNTQRQMQVPSSLDKLIIGIWEQLHSGVSVDPVQILGEFMAPPLLGDAISPSQDVSGPSLSTSSALVSASLPGRRFNDTTVLCRKVTQASRTCRSIEVIVQARWVEHFDAYVEHLKANDPKSSVTRHRKAASVEASSSFGWSEKELRNKMAIWRGYKEIKERRRLGYRIGFDNESIQRLRHLRPALEVAADTMNPNWRRLLSIVGEPPERVYAGHPHDWVVCLDGSPPIQLRKTYLQWDPHFEYKHLEESVIDQAAWGCDDPRWRPPSSEALTRVSSLFVCQDCSNEQSDDPKLNCCYCFPSLFGCATLTPPPVQVFRTPDGRNNGLMALCAFERGAAVGEFVGVITKGLQDVDVMEDTTGSAKYQIWQGRQGNFTRFVNHSCNANAQYQRFTWLDTQRIILVSKGIEAGSEITVDYSDKYWKGLDKTCLCGEKSWEEARRSQLW
ncbi:hypothetical protein EKO27_g1836 [Xylaria grammica]|uniref:SET domain-containing protein n=1 Tax=Xylaria grammica TaxID=363999 RepID=A0A439DFX4_9PEZI|nr:hypothetical protein EKO27_g1836 [Xylaria grammica]